MVSVFFKSKTHVELSGECRVLFPKCDLEETDKYFLLSFDLPGVKKDDLKIELKGFDICIEFQIVSVLSECKCINLKSLAFNINDYRSWFIVVVKSYIV